MESQRVDELKEILNEIKTLADEKTATKLELDKCNRIVERLASFSPDCEECEQLFPVMEKHVFEMREQIKHIDSFDSQQHRQIITSISSHLTKQHKLITSGYYLSIYMSLGTSLGLMFGLLFLDNIALGLPIGLCIGLGIGSSLDADAKKKDLVL
ncbi:hypothetical protein [Ornithinibacillus sp. 179-J 7C1 HS]|uniref:hypothetical protein n=1 Tax=Ornithinibacillus sp. 179-J 7C1 HS TaxID=3142384 RepID=UPI0039A3E802